MGGKIKELEKRVALLEEFVFGMNLEAARQFLKSYDKACKNLKGEELDSYIAANSQTLKMAEKILGALVYR